MILLQGAVVIGAILLGVRTGGIDYLVEVAKMNLGKQPQCVALIARS